MSTTYQAEALYDSHTAIIQDVMIERARQLNKFGPQDRPPFEWFLILSEEVGEVAKECVEMQFDDAKHPHSNPEAYRKELVEVAAVALAALQNFDQRKGRVVEPQPFTEASTQEALTLLDGATSEMSEETLLALIDAAAQKLRGVSLSEEDAELVALAKKYPLDIPFLNDGCQKICGNYHCSLKFGHGGYCAVVPNQTTQEGGEGK